MRRVLRQLGRGVRESREPILVFVLTRGALFLLAYLSLAVLPLNSDPGIAGPSGGPWRGFPEQPLARRLGPLGRRVVRAHRDPRLRRSGRRRRPASETWRSIPLYPLAMRVVSFTGLSPLAAGILVSNLAFLAALLLLHRMARARFGAEAASGASSCYRSSPSPSTSAPRTRRACSCSWPSPRCSWASGGTGPGRRSARSSAAPRGCPGSPSRRRSASSISTGSGSTSGRCARTSSGSG